MAPPKVQSLIVAEVQVLGALLASLRGGAEVDAEFVRSLWKKLRPEDAEGWLRHAAMAKFLGEPVEVPDLKGGEGVAGQLFVRTARAWMLWAAGRDDEARMVLTTTVCEPLPHEGGELHLMALGPWCRGVGALLRGDREEARRYFRRSTEIGSQLGTETSNAIQWAYVATFHKA